MSEVKLRPPKNLLSENLACSRGGVAPANDGGLKTAATKAACVPAKIVEGAQSRTAATTIPRATNLLRRGAVIGFALLCGIEFYFSAAASVRGVGIISMDQIDAGRMYMLAR